MKRGFTLIEIMLAITILSIVATLVYGGFAQTARNKARVETDLDYYRTVQMALSRMSREISMAFVSTHVNPSPSLQNVQTAFIGKDHGRRDRLDFTSFSHQRLYRDAHESDQNEISYFVAKDPNDSSREVLARREQNRIDDDPQKGGRSQILVEGVEEFEIEYLDPVSGEWVKSWDTTQAIGQPNRLPSQVKIRLVVEDPQRPNQSRTFGTRSSPAMVWALNHASYNP